MLKLSQTAAILIYLGEKYHILPSEPTDQVLAKQYICDQQDLFNVYVAPTQAMLLRLKVALTEKAYHQMLDHCNLIERQIKGPFYFGEKACYVDYALVALIETMKSMHRQTFKAFRNTPIGRKMTKISRTLKAEPYYKKVQGIPVWPDALIVTKGIAKAAVKLDQPSKKPGSKKTQPQDFSRLQVQEGLESVQSFQAEDERPEAF